MAEKPKPPPPIEVTTRRGEKITFDSHSVQVLSDLKDLFPGVRCVELRKLPRW